MTDHPMTSVDSPQGARRTHRLKTWPSYFAALVDGSKTFEVRRNDRDFAVGDELILIEWDPSKSRNFEATGRGLRVRVSYVMRGGQFGIDPLFCVIGFASPPQPVEIDDYGYPRKNV